MKPKTLVRLKAILIVTIAVKLGGTVCFLSGTAAVSEILFHQPVAIAQEKATTAEVKPSDASQAAPKRVKKTPLPDVGAVLKRLEMERRRLEEKEERIKQQRVQLEALKTEIDGKIERLSKIQNQITADLEKKEAMLAEKERQQQAAEEERLKMLSKVYASMKPKKAAAIIDKMDIEIIQKVFSQMKGEQVGNILSYVEKELAAKISERLAANALQKSPDTTR